jgi:hypothetical protein
MLFGVQENELPKELQGEHPDSCQGNPASIHTLKTAAVNPSVDQTQALKAPQLCMPPPCSSSP